MHYLERGLGDRDAKLKAMAEVKGYLTAGSLSTVRALPAGSTQSETESSVQLSGTKARIRAYLSANPDVRQLSINQALSVLHANGMRASRTTVAEVLREIRKSA